VPNPFQELVATIIAQNAALHKTRLGERASLRGLERLPLLWRADGSSLPILWSSSLPTGDGQLTEGTKLFRMDSDEKSTQEQDEYARMGPSTEWLICLTA
jgi:hypothetical protein